MKGCFILLRNALTILIMFHAFPLFGQGNSQDTTFIMKDSLHGTAQSIYINNNPNSLYYDKIIQFQFQGFDSEGYQSSISYLKENKLNLSTKRPLIPWTKWVILKQYKGKHYAYHPCDFNSHFRISMNDSTLIDWTGEGPVANKIIGQTKKDNATFNFRLSGIFNTKRTLTVHIIDRKNGIAVFEEANGKSKNYTLMIAAEKIKSVPLIINNCEINKQTELNFEEPDFAGMLQNRK